MKTENKKTFANRGEPARGADLRVWHIANVPGEPYHHYVQTPEEGAVVLRILRDYDLYLGESAVYSNAGGLEVMEDGEWCEWCNEDGYDINEVIDDADDFREVPAL